MNWKGEKVGYKSLHQWVRKYLPKPKICPKCEIRKPKEVANLDHKYSRDLKSWAWLCILCHRTLDGQVKWFIENRKNFKMKGWLKGKKMPKEIKNKISKTMKHLVKARRRNKRGVFI